MSKATMFGVEASGELSEFLTRHTGKKLLTREEIYELIPRAQAGDMAARQKIVERNIFLVVSQVGKYARQRKHHHLNIDDLMQEGFIGLLRAIEKFDPERGNAFSTYAVWWIKQKISRAYDDMDLSIRHPVHVKEVLRRFYRIKDEMEREAGHEIHIDVVWAELMRRRPETSDQAYRAIRSGVVRNPRSLDEELKFAGSGVNNEGKTLGPAIPDPHAHDEVTGDHLPLGQESLDSIISALPERQEYIVRLRHGLCHEEDYPRTLDEVGQVMGLTRERVRQILMSATVFMRREFSRRGYELPAGLALTVTEERMSRRVS